MGGTMNKGKKELWTRDDANKEGWDHSPATENVRREDRSLDIGESGQFAPGGYSNQHGVNEPRRPLNDDDIVPPARNSRSR